MTQSKVTASEHGLLVAPQEVWQWMKTALLPFDGAASQMYVLDIPFRSMKGVIKAFSEFVCEVSAPTVDNVTFDPAKPLTQETISAFVSADTEDTVHQLRGRRCELEVVSMYFWTTAVQKTFDVEVVFWVDQVFPHTDDAAACVSSVADYVAFADRLRAPQSTCLFSANKTGNPRDDRDKPWTFWW